MTAPLVSDIRQEQFLANVLDMALQPDTDFVHDKVAPTVNVTEKSGIYHSVPRGQMTRTEAQFRAYGVPAPLTEWNLARKRFTCETIELAAPVYDDIINQCPNDLDVLSMTTTGLARKIKLKKELMWVAKFLQPSVWTGFAPGGVVQDFDVSNKAYSQGCFDLADSNPELTLNFARRIGKLRSGGLKMGTLVVTEDVWNEGLKSHPVIKDDIKYTQNALVLQNSEAAKNIVAQALGVDTIHVVEAIANTAHEGQAPNEQYMSQNCMLLLYTSPQPSLMTTSAMYTFNYTGDPNATGGESGQMRSWYEAPTRRRIYEAATSFDFNIVASDCGIFFKNCLSK